LLLVAEGCVDWLVFGTLLLVLECCRYTLALMLKRVLIRSGRFLALVRCKGAMVWSILLIVRAIGLALSTLLVGM
jgi:hypothetical protein